MSVFVDTSALFAIMDADDNNHARAAGVWRELIGSGQALVTTSYVLVESSALIQSRLGLEAARGFCDDLVPVLSVEFVTSDIHRLGTAALLAASKRGLSLVDCVSFETMRELGIRSAFTFDRHFREYGFTALP
ncbi:MAG: PIN domain-containing protein [Syntrophorhabdus sp.]|jgi:predicted nucleic acid-binding protein|nr:PIN domain-containing protein [Syntrophorhabdus sp.]